MQSSIETHNRQLKNLIYTVVPIQFVMILIHFILNNIWALLCTFRWKLKTCEKQEVLSEHDIFQWFENVHNFFLLPNCINCWMFVKIMVWEIRNQGFYSMFQKLVCAGRFFWISKFTIFISFLFQSSAENLSKPPYRMRVSVRGICMSCFIPVQKFYLCLFSGMAWICMTFIWAHFGTPSTPWNYDWKFILFR